MTDYSRGWREQVMARIAELEAENARLKAEREAMVGALREAVSALHLCGARAGLPDINEALRLICRGAFNAERKARAALADAARPGVKEARMSKPTIHVHWGPDADKLSDNERQAIVEKLTAAAQKHHEQEEAARSALEGLSYVAISVDQLADIYKRLLRLTRLGQSTIDELMNKPKELLDLRRAIFAEADFGALFAGQWLPRDVRDRCREEAHGENVAQQHLSVPRSDETRGNP